MSKNITTSEIEHWMFDNAGGKQCNTRHVKNGVGTKFEFPTAFEHYFVYWLCPCVAAILASIIYTIYAGGTIFGSTLPLGPIRKPATKTKTS